MVRHLLLIFTEQTQKVIYYYKNEYNSPQIVYHSTNPCTQLIGYEK